MFLGEKLMFPVWKHMSLDEKLMFLPLQQKNSK